MSATYQGPAVSYPERRNTARSVMGSIKTNFDSRQQSRLSLPYAPNQPSDAQDVHSPEPKTAFSPEEVFTPRTRMDYDTLPTPAQEVPSKSLLTYGLPTAVASVRDGWQLTSQSGAVVSGLLAAVASQLLGFFEGNKDLKPEGAKGMIIGTCYAAIFLNINATIGSFVLIDHLGELGFEAARLHMAGRLDQVEFVGHNHSEVGQLLKEFGAGRMWKFMLVHWLLTFYFGILSLIISVLTYVVVAEGRTIKITMCVLVGITLLPTMFFILFGGYGKKARRKVNVSHGNGVN